MPSSVNSWQSHPTRPSDSRRSPTSNSPLSPTHVQALLPARPTLRVPPPPLHLHSRSTLLSPRRPSPSSSPSRQDSIHPAAGRLRQPSTPPASPLSAAATAADRAPPPPRLPPPLFAGIGLSAASAAL